MSVPIDPSWDLTFPLEGGWLDEIRINDEEGVPLLRATTKYRFKTSDLSGNEWRTSVMWQARRSCMHLLKGDAAVDIKDPRWVSYDGPYHDLQTAAVALYPGLYSSQKNLHRALTKQVEFRRKGRTLYSSSLDNRDTPLLTLAGHLPWALVDAGDQALGTKEAWADMERLCHQHGCREEAVSAYHAPMLNLEGRPAKTYVRLFCPTHLNRGDQNPLDRNAFYEVLHGPGPYDKPQLAYAYRSEAREVRVHVGEDGQIIQEGE